MITIGKFTGEIEDNQLVIVELLNGDVAACRPSFAFPMVAVPTKKWLDKYSDKYMAVVAFVDDYKEKPLLIGMRPLMDINFPTEGYENNYLILSEQFRLWFNDDDKKLIADVLNDGKILLGNKDVTEPGVLGNKNEAVLKKLAQELINVYNALSSAVIIPNDGGASLKSTMLGSLGTLISNMQGIINNDAPGTKSDTVKLK